MWVGGDLLATSLCDRYLLVAIINYCFRVFDSMMFFMTQYCTEHRKLESTREVPMHVDTCMVYACKAGIHTNNKMCITLTSLVHKGEFLLQSLA